MLKLLVLQWKESTRSLFWEKSILINLFLGFIGLYLSFNLVFISLFADKLILQAFGEVDIIEFSTRLIIYYFLFDLIVRFLWQTVPILSIQPYLTLPIQKSTLLHYPIVKSVFSFINLIALLLLLPFFFRHIYLTQTFLFSLAWLITVLALILGNNFLNFFLKKYFSKQALVVILSFVGLGVFFYLDFKEVISISKQLYVFISFISASIFLIFLPVLFPAASYYLAYSLIKNNAYIEDRQVQTVNKSKEFTFLNNFGDLGQSIRLELKLILRNKRPRSMLYISIAFILYGFIVYNDKNMDNLLILSFAGMFLPGMFPINYGQFLFSWESSFFSCFLANRISPFNYIKSKHLILSVFFGLGYLLILPYALIDYRIAFINLAFLVYNIGFNAMVLVYFSTFNISYIDLGRSQFMNYQGTGFSQFLIIIPLLGVPVLIYLLLTAFNITSLYFYALLIIGLIGIVLNKQIIELIVKQFMRRKYMMAVGFRQK